MSLLKKLEDMLWDLQHKGKLDHYSWDKDILKYLIKASRIYEKSSIDLDKYEEYIKTEIKEIIEELSFFIENLKKLL